ncbi:MAG: hypothetical protein ACRC6M_15990 [Microcystaceae cyanobacterium]
MTKSFMLLNIFSPLKNIRFLLTSSLVLTFTASVFPWSVKAQISQAVIQEIIDGDQVFIQQKQAKVEDTAQFGQIVLTKDSRAGILFNNGALGRLGNNAKVTVGQCVEVEKGELLISGPVNGCMAGLTVAVKGTLYLLKKTDENSGTVQVLEGTVQVTNQDKPGEVVEVTSGQEVAIFQGILGQAIPMTPEAIAAILSGQLFSGFQIPVTPDGALQTLCSQLLPGLSCSTTGLPSYPIPTPPIPLPFSLPF